jgi:proton-dependent oligopeptide transporter, POT family
MRSEYQIMLGAWGIVGAWISFVIFSNRKVHPKALFFLFMVELWERFSYYGMRALLVIYLTSLTCTGGISLEKKSAVGIYAAYGALVYLTPLLGGMLSDKILGFRRSIIWGASLMALGQFCLSTSAGTPLFPYAQVNLVGSLTGGPGLAAASTTERTTLDLVLLYSGLALLILGNGFFKPNISSLIGKFYGPGDPRRDGAFTIFYMGINIGAFLTPLTCGTIGELEGWKYGFLIAGCGMVLGLLIFLYTTTTGFLEQHADPPASAEGLKIGPFSAALPTCLISLALLPVIMALIRWNDAMDYLLGGIGLLTILYMLYLSFQYPLEEKQRIWVIVVLLFFTTVFWALFELAGSALTLFAESNVNRTIFSVTFTVSNFQAANAFFIMIFAPIFSIMWIMLAKPNVDKEPNAAVKFAIGLFLVGAGFLILNIGKGYAVAGLVPGIYLILLYLFHTLGELAISPVGLSLVTKLAPARLVGFMMGFWFLSSAIAHQAGKWIAQGAVAPEDASTEEKLAKALEVFNNVGYFAIGSGVVLLILSPVLKKWMHGVK